MAVLFAAIWANLETVRLGYQLENVEKQREALVERNRQLRTARAEASALARVEEIAHRALGLAAPRPDQLILVEDAALAPPAAAPARPAPPVDELIGPPAPVSTEEGF